MKKIILYFVVLAIILHPHIACGTAVGEENQKNVGFIFSGVLPTSESYIIANENACFSSYQSFHSTLEQFKPKEFIEDNAYIPKPKEWESLAQMDIVGNFLKDKLGFSEVYVIWISPVYDNLLACGGKNEDLIDNIDLSLKKIEAYSQTASNTVILINSHYSPENEHFCMAETPEASSGLKSEDNFPRCFPNAILKRSSLENTLRDIIKYKGSENRNTRVLVGVDSCEAGDVFAGMNNLYKVNYMISSFDFDVNISNYSVGFTNSKDDKKNGCFIEERSFKCDKNSSKCFPISPFYCEFIRQSLTRISHQQMKKDGSACKICFNH